MQVSIELIIYILLLLIPFLLYFVNFKKQISKYKDIKDIKEDFWSYVSYPIKHLHGYWLSPWNMSSRSTRNMSYDLRGDIPTTKYNISPWLNSSLMPIYNKPLWMVS